MLDNERLAIEPQLILDFGGREMCERCMKTRDEQVEWDKTHKTGGREMKTVEVVNKGEIDQAKRKAILHHKVGACPQCSIGDLWAVCTVKNLDTEDYSPECDHCGYVDNK